MLEICYKAHILTHHDILENRRVLLLCATCGTLCSGELTLENLVLSAVLGWVVGRRPIVRMWDLGLWGGECPPWGVFLRDPSTPYTSFGENSRKLRTAKSTSATDKEYF